MKDQDRKKSATEGDRAVPTVVERLRAAGCVFAEDEAALLAAAPVSAAERDELVRRRIDGEPLEHLLGWVEFCGKRHAIETGVFVPRRRTELLARLALPVARGAGVVVELCCGCAALGAALAAELPRVELHACDIDPAAVRSARRNVTHVHEGDLFAALPPGLSGRIDVVVANAPYVPSAEIMLMPPEARDHEPRISLDGGTDGLDVQRRIVTDAPRWLATRGHLLIESSNRQAGALAAEFEANGFEAEIASDEELGATVVSGRLR
jgi:release factor glutamine methyltransferase